MYYLLVAVVCLAVGAGGAVIYYRRYVAKIEGALAAKVEGALAEAVAVRKRLEENLAQYAERK